jgi:hypothetical protein
MWRGRLFTMLATTFVWRKKFAAEVVVTRKGSPQHYVYPARRAPSEPRGAFPGNVLQVTRSATNPNFYPSSPLLSNVKILVCCKYFSAHTGVALHNGWNFFRPFNGLWRYGGTHCSGGGGALGRRDPSITCVDHTYH